MTTLGLAETREFSRADYQRIAGISKSSAVTDLGKLAEIGLVRRRGQGPAARYRLASGDWPETRGRPRKWTDERIEQELREFCAGRTDWPSVAEFKEAGRGALYGAVTRFGGTRLWAEKLGLSR